MSTYFWPVYLCNDCWCFLKLFTREHLEHFAFYRCLDADQISSLYRTRHTELSDWSVINIWRLVELEFPNQTKPGCLFTFHLVMSTRRPKSIDTDETLSRSRRVRGSGAGRSRVSSLFTRQVYKTAVRASESTEDTCRRVNTEVCPTSVCQTWSQNKPPAAERFISSGLSES